MFGRGAGSITFMILVFGILVAIPRISDAITRTWVSEVTVAHIQVAEETDVVSLQFLFEDGSVDTIKAPAPLGRRGLGIKVFMANLSSTKQLKQICLNGMQICTKVTGVFASNDLFLHYEVTRIYSADFVKERRSREIANAYFIDISKSHQMHGRNYTHRAQGSRLTSP